MTLMERRFCTDELALNYAEGPSRGQAVVFLHGTVARWQSWLSVLPALAEQTHIFALDARGYGTSGWSPAQRYHYLDFVHEAARFLRGAVREPAVLIGHSRGATVAMAVAVVSPEIVKGLFIQEPTLRRRALGGNAEQHTRIRDLIVDQDVPELARLLLEVDPKAAPARSPGPRREHDPHGPCDP